jgi:hypothetical protein
VVMWLAVRVDIGGGGGGDWLAAGCTRRHRGHGGGSGDVAGCTCRHRGGGSGEVAGRRRIGGSPSNRGRRPWVCTMYLKM